ncbi:MAG: hypothetical protein ABSA13_16045 [Beijerinckiaceae bacterium]
MELGDAATILIALLATGSPTKAPAYVKKLGALTPIPFKNDESAFLRRAGFHLRPELTFRACLEDLLFWIASTLKTGLADEKFSTASVSFQTPPDHLWIDIGFEPKGPVDFATKPQSSHRSGVTISFASGRHKLNPSALRSYGLIEFNGLIVKRSITNRTLAAVAAEIAESSSVKQRLQAASRSRRSSYEW